MSLPKIYTQLFDSNGTSQQLKSDIIPSSLAKDSNVVHIDKNETITGTKTFSSPIVGNITGSANQATNDSENNNISTTYAKIIELHNVSFSGDYTSLSNKPIIDSELSSTSTNAIQNKVVYQELANINTSIGTLDLDTATVITQSSGDSSNKIASTEFVQNEITRNLNSYDALIYKGIIYSGEISSSNQYGSLTPVAKKGDVYKIASTGYVNGIYVELGDMLICNEDTSKATSSTYSNIIQKWDVIQGNLDNVVQQSGSSTNNHIVFFTDTKNIIKDSGYTIEKSVPSNAIFTDTNDKVLQSFSNTNNTYPLLATNIAQLQENKTEGTIFTPNIYINPSTKEITALKFNGEVNGNSSTATKLKKARNIILSGAFSSSASFDGSENIELSVNSIDASKLTGEFSLTAPEAKKVSNSLCVKFNSGTTENTDKFSFDGSSTKSVNIVSGEGINISNTNGSIVIKSSASNSYSVADTNNDGLMSSSDKLKLNGLSSFYIKGTQTEPTNDWTGNLPNISSLYDGLTIDYWLPYDSLEGNYVSLKLKLKDNIETLKIPCYIEGLNRLSNEIKKENICRIVYQTITYDSVEYSGFWILNSSDTNDKVKQVYNIDNKDFSLLFKKTNNNTDETDSINYNNNFTYNPYTKKLSVEKLFSKSITFSNDIVLSSSITENKESFNITINSNDTTNKGNLLEIGSIQFPNKNLFSGIRIGNPRKENLPTNGTDCYASIGIYYDYENNIGYPYTTCTNYSITDDSVNHIATTHNIKECIPISTGSSTLPVYVNSSGKITACNTSLDVDISGNANKATYDTEGELITSYVNKNREETITALHSYDIIPKISYIEDSDNPPEEIVYSEVASIDVVDNKITALNTSLTSLITPLATDSEVVHIESNESIIGNKTFTTLSNKISTLDIENIVNEIETSTDDLLGIEFSGLSENSASINISIEECSVYKIIFPSNGEYSFTINIDLPSSSDVLYKTTIILVNSYNHTIEWNNVTWRNSSTVFASLNELSADTYNIISLMTIGNNICLGTIL